MSEPTIQSLLDKINGSLSILQEAQITAVDAVAKLVDHNADPEAHPGLTLSIETSQALENLRDAINTLTTRLNENDETDEFQTSEISTIKTNLSNLSNSASADSIYALSSRISEMEKKVWIVPANSMPEKGTNAYQSLINALPDGGIVIVV